MGCWFSYDNVVSGYTLLVRVVWGYH